MWERELPKLIGDARYQAIVNMKDRRALFEEFCKKNTADKKRQKVEPQPALLERDGSVDESEVTQDAFKALLQETLQGGLPRFYSDCLPHPSVSYSA